MKSTVYETRFYPETQIKWGSVPGCEFIGKTLIKFLQKKFSLAGSKSSTGIAGIANGGRGALLAAINYNGTFGAAVGLSGDYDPLSMTGEKRLISVYGDPKAFPSRWENDDNIVNMADKLQKTAVFLAHGGKDGYVPSGQSLILAVKIQQLKKRKGGFDFTFVEKKYGSHDWRFWQSMTSDVMAFFDTKLK
jgi:S-formylglutathione hydrolase FrmB